MKGNVETSIVADCFEGAGWCEGWQLLGEVVGLRLLVEVRDGGHLVVREGGWRGLAGEVGA